jgi:hypothetical protein
VWYVRRASPRWRREGSGLSRAWRDLGPGEAVCAQAILSRRRPCVCPGRRVGGNIQTGTGRAQRNFPGGAEQRDARPKLFLSLPTLPTGSLRTSGWGREVCPGPVTHGVWAREPVSQTCRAAPWDFSERDAVMGSLASRSGGRGWIRYDTRNDVGRRCLVLLGFKCIVSMWVGEGRMRDRPGCRNKARTGKTGVGLIQIGSICVRLISSTYKLPPVMNATREGSMTGMSLRSLARG